MLEVDQVESMRYLHVKEGRSIRSIAQEFGVSRNSVRRYLRGAPPGQRRKADRASPVLDKIKGAIDEILAQAPSWTQGKQKLTAARVRQLLAMKEIHAGRTVVSEYVAERRRQSREVFVPLVHRPGDSAQVDFFELSADVVGKRQKAYMFLMHFMHSKRDFFWIYDRQDQLSFLDGHARAFAHLGYIPARLVYDNLSSAVRKIIGAERRLTERFAALVSHYGFEPCFARPGEGHDKGGVEARGKGIRWNYLVPIPTGESSGAISQEALAAADAKHNVEAWAEETRCMRPTVEPFVCCQIAKAFASRQAIVRFLGAFYSVPCEWNGLEILIRIFPERLEMVHRDQVVHHPRMKGGKRSIDYRHYLRELSRKPQALRQVAPELLAVMGEPFASAYARLQQKHEPREAARMFAEILRLVQRFGQPFVAERLTEALDKDRALLFTLRENVAEISAESIPESLRVQVAAAKASDYDYLLEAGVQ
jgi:transposase